jgi:hypothetical protein
MKRLLIGCLATLMFLTTCGKPADDTAEALAETLLMAIAQQDSTTYMQYAVFHDRAKVLSAFVKARESGIREGVNWDSISVRSIKLDNGNDYVVTFESAKKPYSIKFYSIEKSGKGFVKKTSVIGSVRKVRASAIEGNG